MNTQILPGPNLPNDVGQHAVDRGALESPLIWQALLLLALLGVYLAFRPRRATSDRIGAPALPMSAKLIPIIALAASSAAMYVNTYVGYIRTGNDFAAMLERSPGWAADLGHGLANVTGSTDNYLTRARTQLANNGQPKPGPPDPDLERRRHELRIEKIDIPDPALAVPTGRTTVLLPPGYDAPENARRHYPVVYLVHGYPAGSSDDWFTSGDAIGTMKQLSDHSLVQPMIIVGVDATAGVTTTDWECLNVPHGPQLESYLADSVPRQIDLRYRTIGNRAGRALGGMSGGGFCALNVGLKHLPQFATILSALPYDDPGDARTLLGDPALIAANTPRIYLPTMTFPLPVAVMLDVGEHAATDVNTARRIAGLFAAKGQPVALRLEPNLNHTWRTARAGLPYLLTFASQRFPIVDGAGRTIN